MNIPKDQLIEDLKRVAGVLGTTVLTKDNYDLTGRYSAEALRRRFGSWGEALRLAGLEQTPGHAKIENDDLFSNMASVWESLGRQPKQSDLRPPISRFSPKTYNNHFGSWRKALEAFVAVANDPTLDSPTPIEASASFVSPQTAPSRRTPRQPGWRLRFLVNRRDRFTCRACGRSPATNDGTQLHLDHVKPWSEGGETTFDNLQTLCQICNIGKSALAMYEDGVKIT
jgi:5-methylcytosine-specific restriction endonuclease McrA